jgi:hypothetical protein
MSIDKLICSNNPEIVHKNKDTKWYFWDETYSIEHGPFETRELTQEALNKYCKEELGHPE